MDKCFNCTHAGLCILGEEYNIFKDKVNEFAKNQEKDNYKEYSTNVKIDMTHCQHYKKRR